MTKEWQLGKLLAVPGHNKLTSALILESRPNYSLPMIVRVRPYNGPYTLLWWCGARSFWEIHPDDADSFLYRDPFLPVLNCSHCCCVVATFSTRKELTVIAKGV